MNLACFVTSPLNKALHMDPHVSRLVRPVTQIIIYNFLKDHNIQNKNYMVFVCTGVLCTNARTCKKELGALNNRLVRYCII